jgi:hypothetical protein
MQLNITAQRVKVRVQSRTYVSRCIQNNNRYKHVAKHEVNCWCDALRRGLVRTTTLLYSLDGTGSNSGRREEFSGIKNSPHLSVAHQAYCLTGTGINCRE